VYTYKMSQFLTKMLKNLNTPDRIQDYLDQLPFNFEKNGETYFSPLKVLENKRAHCFEGACFAVAAMQANNKKAFLLDLKVKDLNKDSDHVLAVYKQAGCWGAISKTNHAALRWRDPIYLSIRELATSYFHEYFLSVSGEKTLHSYSQPFDILKKFGKVWMNSEEDLDDIALALDKSKHFNFYPEKLKKYIRKVSKIERRAGGIEEWKLGRK